MIRKMNYTLISEVANSPPATKLGIESVSATLGEVVFFLGFLTSAIALIKLIIDISAKATQLKNDIDRADLIINNKIDILSGKIEQNSSVLDEEMLSIQRRTISVETRLQDIELFLSAKHGFIARRYQPINDDLSSLS